MRVLIIPSWYPTQGDEIMGSFFREQAQALKKNGCEVAVIYPQLQTLRHWPSITSLFNEIKIEDDCGVTTFRMHAVHWYVGNRLKFERRWLDCGVKLFDEYTRRFGKPDIIHAHSIFFAGMLAYELNVRHAIPYVITEHSTAFARALVPKSDIQRSTIVACSASRRFAVSHEFSNLLTEMLGDWNAPWEVMPNIVHDSFINYPIRQCSSKKNFRFINVALMTDKKRQKNIVYAFAHAFRDISDVDLTIAGDGPEATAIKSLASQLGLAKRIRFPGKLTRAEVLEEIAASNAFVLSSRFETFGVVIIEALALGKPVVATKCGGPESIIRDQDGILVPVDDVPSLANAMRKIYEDSLFYDAYEIRAACGARFGERAIAQRLTDCYFQITEANAIAER